MKRMVVALLVLVSTLRPALADRTIGGIGVDVRIDKGRLLVIKTLDGLPAAKAGIKPGDEIVSVDDHPIDPTTLETACAPLAGAVGTPVTVAVRHGDKTRALTLQRAGLVVPSVTFDAIPYQRLDAVFQISVHVTDDAGRPVPGAHVHVALDRGHTSTHVLFISTRNYLKNASGYVVDQVEGITDATGTAPIWVRLDGAATPFKAQLTATVQGHAPVQSNVFTVDRRD